MANDTERAIAEELRAAAKTLREKAVKPLEGIEAIYPGDADEWTKYYGRESLKDIAEGDGPWITLMTPLLAEPLASWLEAAAEGWRWAHSLADSGTHPAVLVARVINGGGS